METWSRLTILRGKGESKMNQKDLIRGYALLMDAGCEDLGQGGNWGNGRGWEEGTSITLSTIKILKSKIK